MNFAEYGLDGVTCWPAVTQNLVPCSFYGVRKSLAPGESVKLYEMIGQAENQSALSKFAMCEFCAGYFDNKREQAEALTEKIGNYMATKTADPVSWVLP